VVEARVFKFCILVKYSLKVDRPPANECGQNHVTHFKFCGPSDICGMAKARLINTCIQIGYIK